MSHLKITDNHDWIELTRVNGYEKDLDFDNLKKIANIRIDSLSIDDNQNLLVFPNDINKYGDKISESCILSLYDNKIKTGNIMGFVGVNETQLTISSRFDENGNDYFMHYMLQRVFSINLFDMKHSTSADPIFDFLIYLFPYYLKKALAQGIFKKYKRFEHNDANVRGTINVNEHIRKNIPFRGTVAYTTREHSYDNEITQLIRHTIEYIHQKEAGKTILYNDAETKNCVSQIIMATQSYSSQKRNQVINQNLRPVRHPYYSEYTTLQKICLQILRHETIKFGSEKDQVYGVLFDGAWLWEEYLYTILKNYEFKHPQNKINEGGIRMFLKPDNVDDYNDGEEDFNKCYRKLYPDFYNETNKIILDAKYKRLERNVGREDLYQVVTYMHCMEYKLGGYIYPANNDCQMRKYELAGLGGTIKVIPLHIPQAKNNWGDFVGDMKSYEDDFIKQLQ
ncbi:MAG: McrC family protein [Paludibacteraceae bacterium]|nr:McrC family protein [Paludibacteraceae bacterium]